MRVTKPRLTQRIIDAAKPNGREQFHWDHQIKGLAFRMRATGARSFIYQYRATSGRVGRCKVGDPAILTLEQARKEARELAYRVAHDEDPSATKILSRNSTFEAAWLQYEENRVSQLSPAHQVRTKGIFKALILPALGQRPIRSVTRGDVRSLTDKTLTAGKPAMANNVHRAASSFLSWCVDREYLHSNPLYGIRQPSRNKSRDRTLNDCELATVWRYSTKLNSQWCPAIRLLMVTGLRKTEVLGAEIREIDVQGRKWTIPEERSKNRHAHTVYLTDLAIEIIKGIPKFGGQRYLFESSRTTKPRSVEKTTASIRKLKKIVPIENWRLHDLRRSVATHMGRLNIPTHVIEVVLNHRSGFRSGVAGIYNRYDYAPEAKAAWELWSRALHAWVTKEYPPPPPIIDEDDAVVI